MILNEKLNEKSDDEKVYISSGHSVKSVASDDFIFEQLDERYRQKLYEKMGHGILEDEDVKDEEMDFLFDKTNEMRIDTAIGILHETISYHSNDPNFPANDYELIKRLVKGVDENTDMHPEDWAFNLKMFAALNEYHSPYPEVRAITSPIDDPNTPVETIRAYFLGFLWACLGTLVNEFFSHRKPSISLNSAVCQMLLLPCGKLLQLLPDWGFVVKGTRHSLNPGPWNYKEQMFATIIFNVAIGGMYVSSNIYVQKMDVFYGSKWITVGYQILLAVSTQFLGFGFAGILRKVAIYPVNSIWPSILSTMALNRALLKDDKKENINGWRASRMKFFFITCIGSFTWFWFPDYIFTALSTFNWTTWIAPDNFDLAAITGTVNGLGVNPVPTFDWNTIGFSSPLVIPFYSQLNTIIGMIISFFCIVGVYYTNYKWSAYLPINGNDIYNNKAEVYDVQAVITNGKLDEKKYKKYGPPYYTAANLVLYGAYFATYPAVIIYTFFDEWTAVRGAFKSVFDAFTSFGKSNFAKFNDPHSRMMAKYKETPDWWFLIVLLGALVCGIVCVTVYPVHTPVWGIFFTIGINFIFLVPLTIIQSITGVAIGLNVLVELIVGYALPGNGDALMTLKAFGYNIGGQAEGFVSDQKMAHYAKIPPRAIFRGQMISTCFQILVSLCIINWEMTGIKGICTPHQAQKFSCPSEVTYYSSSVLWGVIGPKRVFGMVYPILKYCFLIGAVVGLFFVGVKMYFKQRARFMVPIAILSGFLSWAPYNFSYVVPGFYVGFVFNYFIKNRWPSWWIKYNYILSSGLNTGVAFSAIIIFFCVQYKGVDFEWWGNSISYMGVDGGVGRTTLLNATNAPGGYFGLRNGTFS